MGRVAALTKGQIHERLAAANIDGNRQLTLVVLLLARIEQLKKERLVKRLAVSGFGEKVGTSSESRKPLRCLLRRLGSTPIGTSVQNLNDLMLRTCTSMRS